MPLLNPSQLSPEEERNEVITDAIIDEAPAIPGFQCVRGLSPLVIVALQRANNPYMTARRGFDAIGIQFDESGKQLTSSAEFGIAMLPKTAEVLVLVSCSRDELKWYSKDPESLESAALDLVDATDMGVLVEATSFVAKLLEATSKSKVDPAPEDEKPSAAAIEEGGTNAKKLVRTGSRKS